MEIIIDAPNDSQISEVTQELVDLIQVAAWMDEKFASDFRGDPIATVTALVKEHGLNIGDIDLRQLGDIELEANPIGASPVEVHASVEMIQVGPGTINSYTADCGCGESFTGGCSCGSIFGTPCAACATMLLC
jgi:hypothetical protein